MTRLVSGNSAEVQAHCRLLGATLDGITKPTDKDDESATRCFANFFNKQSLSDRGLVDAQAALLSFGHPSVGTGQDSVAYDDKDGSDHWWSHTF